MSRSRGSRSPRLTSVTLGLDHRRATASAGAARAAMPRPAAARRARAAASASPGVRASPPRTAGPGRTAACRRPGRSRRRRRRPRRASRRRRARTLPATTSTVRPVRSRSHQAMRPTAPDGTPRDGAAAARSASSAQLRQLIEPLAQRRRRPPQSRWVGSQSGPARFQTFIAASSPSRMIATAMPAARAIAASASGPLVGKERVEHVLDQVVAVAVPADPDADAGKRIGPPGIDERLHAAMACRAAAELDLHPPEREVRLVVDDDHVARRGPVLARELHRRLAAQVHEGLRARGERRHSRRSSPLARAPRPRAARGRTCRGARARQGTSIRHCAGCARTRPPGCRGR